MIEFELRYTGALADRNMLDAYDASQAIMGFQRTLAIATHLAINGEVITQAPSLRGARIALEAPREGSFRSKAMVFFGGVFAFGSVGKDSPIGHVVTSIYDVMMNETLGIHPDYDKTIQQQVAENLLQKGITKEKIDSAIEKAESGVANMHRPIATSRTATKAVIHSQQSGEPFRKVGPDLSLVTYEYLAHTIRIEQPSSIIGTVSSYNINTFKGRIYSHEHQRPIPFELMPSAQRREQINMVTRSLRLNAADRKDKRAIIELEAHRLESRNGRLKGLHVTDVSIPDEI